VRPSRDVVLAGRTWTDLACTSPSFNPCNDESGTPSLRRSHPGVTRQTDTDRLTRAPDFNPLAGSPDFSCPRRGSAQRSTWCRCSGPIVFSRFMAVFIMSSISNGNSTLATPPGALAWSIRAARATTFSTRLRRRSSKAAYADRDHIRRKPEPAKRRRRRRPKTRANTRRHGSSLPRLSGRRCKFVGGVQGVVGVCSCSWRSIRASRSSRSAVVNFHLNGRALAL
jgi:hypothetical protein